MNLSAQDHQTFFTCDADAGRYGTEIYPEILYVIIIFHLFSVYLLTELNSFSR